MPAPKVDSAVVKIDLFGEPKFSPKNETFFRNLIKAAFEMRRKTLVNAINSKMPHLEKGRIANALISLGFPETVRGEKLSTKNFVDLADLLI
jgi:16S rRNA (adenine1518-N6/adenine1519-N6)-dimethyltransferase